MGLFRAWGLGVRCFVHGSIRRVGRLSKSVHHSDNPGERMAYRDHRMSYHVISILTAHEPDEIVQESVHEKQGVRK